MQVQIVLNYSLYCDSELAFFTLKRREIHLFLEIIYHVDLVRLKLRMTTVFRLHSCRTENIENSPDFSA